MKYAFETRVLNICKTLNMRYFIIYFLIGLSVFTITVAGINLSKTQDPSSQIFHCIIIAVNFCITVSWINTLRLEK